MGLETSFGDSFVTTTLDVAINWCRKYSLWPMPYGTACCGIEMMATLASRFDMSRFGAEAIRFSPRQCDLLLVAGTISLKMAPVLKKIYTQMSEPKWVVAMGACATCGGVFDTYSTLQGIDKIIPVDMYIPGCPPRPEGVLQALTMLQDKITQDTVLSERFKP